MSYGDNVTMSIQVSDEAINEVYEKFKAQGFPHYPTDYNWRRLQFEKLISFARVLLFYHPGRVIESLIEINYEPHCTSPFLIFIFISFLCFILILHSYLFPTFIFYFISRFLISLDYFHFIIISCYYYPVLFSFCSVSIVFYSMFISTSFLIARATTSRVNSSGGLRASLSPSSQRDASSLVSAVSLANFSGI